MNPELGPPSAVPEALPALQGISAVTLATHDMTRAVGFYRSLGFLLRYGGETASFTRFMAGSSYLNLIAQPAEQRWSWWGRVIFHVADMDTLYERALALGLRPEAAPRDAPWGERFFHLTDPDGHRRGKQFIANSLQRIANGLQCIAQRVQRIANGLKCVEVSPSCNAYNA